MTQQFTISSKLHPYVLLLVVLLVGLNVVHAEKFHTAKVIPTNTPPGALAAGDLNGDGEADLVYVGTVVHILISNGDGTFQPETILDPGMTTGAVAIADVNGDGHPDVLAVGGGGTTTATVNVFLGNGDGTFQTPALTSVVAQSGFLFPAITALALGDFDGDGNLDLLASDGLNNDVTFSKGDGLGHFTLQSTLIENAGPSQILVADLNHDGHLDFLVHGGLGADEQVFLGKGDGTFASPVSYRGPHNITGAALADVDGDGNLDLIVSDFDNKVDILLGRADGTFSNLPATPGVLWGAAAGGVFAAGDFNHDGIQDVAVFSRNGITILLGTAGLTFTVSGTYAATALPNPPIIGDFNGDGQPDFAMSGPFDKQIAILLGKPDGKLNAAPAYDVGAAVNSAAIADVNADGIPDLLVGTARSTPSVLLGLGSGDFKLPGDPPLLLFSTRGGSVEVADFNGDSKPDLLFASGGNNAFIQLGNGNGTFQAPAPVGTGTAVNTIVNCARTADINNDHKADVLLDTTVFTGNGDGTFLTPPGTLSSGGVFGCVSVIADLNHHGNLDVAYPQPASSNLLVQLGNGDGTFAPALSIALPNSVSDVAAGDFNGDGNIDLVATGGFNNSAAILLGNGDGTFQSPVALPTGNHQETHVSVGDINGDGNQDLVFSDSFVIR